MKYGDMNMMEVKEDRTTCTQVKDFTVDERYVVHMEFEDDWLDNVTIKEKPSIFTKSQRRDFIFDYTNEEHLELAHHIYVKLCELKEEALRAELQRSTKVNGKAKSPAK